MKGQFKYITFFYFILAIMLPALSLYAQSSNKSLELQKKLLIRDSLDYKYKLLPINTSNNEFSPIPYKGGLLYISNKPIPNEKIAYNKIYWTQDTGFKIIDKSIKKINSSDTIIKYLKLGKTDDFTAPTSNDNDILTRYKRKKVYSNNIEFSFSNFSTDQAFTYNDSLHLIVFAKKSTLTKDGIRHWSLWQANIVNGKLKNKKKILFEDKFSDYLYPYLNNDASKLYLSSNIKNGKGGYDIYYVSVVNGRVGMNLLPIEEINTKNDEIAPSLMNDTIFFSSNKEGGIGGFDAYYKVMNTKEVVQNMGYPVNSEKDEIGLKKVKNEYYLTSNRLGNFDIFTLQYLPINYSINGILTYRNDGSLAPNHLMYLKDKDTDLILDSIKTDKFARYSFIGKPNRDYEFTTLNGDNLYENFIIPITANQNKFNFISYINGRSPKQKADSLNAIWVLQENRRLDSISKYSLQTKFVVHYGFNKSIISKKEKLVLDSLIRKLKLLPKVFISIGAFTDCIGSYKYNYHLSVKRGKAVVNYLIKNGLEKQRIIANGYSKKYTVSPCLTKYSAKTKSIQQNSRRAEIVLSENKKTDWATLEKERGSNYYSVYNSSKLLDETNNLTKSQALLTSIRIQDSIKAAELLIAKKALAEKIEAKRKAEMEAKLLAQTKAKEQALQLKLEKAKQDSIKAAELLIAKQALAEKIQAKRKAEMEAKLLAQTKVKEQALQLKIEKAKQDSIKAAELLIAKKALAEKIEAKRKAEMDAKLLAQTKAKEQALQLKIEKAKQDSIKAAELLIAKKVLAEKIEAKRKAEMEAKLLAQTKAKEKAKEKQDLIAQVQANKKRIKDSIAAASLKAMTAKQNEIKAKAEEDDMTKDEILKSLETLAKLKLEQERIVEYLTKRINKKPILIYVSSDSVSIEIYDNGIHDNDSVSVIYNKRIVVDKQELKVNKPIKFKLKVDKDSKNNELVFVAENLGTEPPNTGVMFITEKSGRRQQVVLSTDMTHNEVIYFIRIEKQ